jgi:hypothetical protein
MANLLIGSSNVARFYKFLIYQDFKEYQLMKCTTMDSFSALMAEIEDGANNVIISVIENIIVDSAKSAKTEEDRSTLITESVRKVIEVIEKTSARLPDSKFCFVMPLKRPAITWFEEKAAEIETAIRGGIASLKTFNVTRLKSFCVSQQQFDKDGVHLTSESGHIFVESVLKSSEEIFNAVNVGNESESETKEEAVPDMGGLVSVLKKRFESDNMMFARLREEVDSNANRSREDRVVITGITSKDPLPTENRPRIERLKELAAEVFQAIKPGFKGKILYASQGRNTETLPMVEVKLDSVEYAVEIRKAFADKRKKEKLSGCLERIFLSNSINVGTRVRIEILKAISKKISNANELAYVASFISRPVMHIKQRNERGERPAKSYTFIDAVKQFGSRLKHDDLLDSYAKAGRSFTGQLEQNFVVLKETESEAAQSTFHKARMQRGRGGFRGRGDRGGGRGRGADRGWSGPETSKSEGPTGKGKKRPSDDTVESSSAKK